MKRTVFFISDRTGITAKILGQALLSQFENCEFQTHTVPFIDKKHKAEALVERINEVESEHGLRPIIFDTIVMPEIREIIRQSNAMIMDFFHTFIGPLETELGSKSSFSVGKTHGIVEQESYDARIRSVNFALNNDDGASTQQYENADIILVGVSRCGKTPTSLYLAMQFGIKAANYPFIPEDMGGIKLPQVLKKYRHKLFGLTINPDRLHEIRTERRANSQYASLTQCRQEIREVESLFRKEKIPFVKTTSRSIEEIATRIMVEAGLAK